MYLKSKMSTIEMAVEIVNEDVHIGKELNDSRTRALTLDELEEICNYIRLYVKTEREKEEE